MSQQITASGKPHYVVLDGLRGVAAIAVVIFHCYEILASDLAHNPIAHGFLAVDFFFCLSGFVIAYAYDGNIQKIGVKRFFINRLIRLQPLVVLGTILGLIGLFIDPFLPVSPIKEFGAGKIAIACLCSVLMLPCPILGRYGNVFPLNAPAWSLSMEYFVNLVYGFVLARISKKILLFFLILSTIAIVFVGFRSGNLLGGWSDETFADGYARVLFSFIAGLVIYRFRLTIINKIPFWIYTIILVGLFVFPHFEGDWYMELFFVVLLFPFILALGAGTKVSDSVQKICSVLGDLSYPLYMTHYWMIWFLGSYAATNPGKKSLYLLSAAIFIAALVLAWLSLRYFDEPVRKWLKTKWEKKKIVSTSNKS